MKKNNPYIITFSRLVIVLLFSSLLVGCNVVLPNAYSKAREKTQKILAHNGFKGKVEVKHIKKVFLDSDDIYVDYTYLEDTYDNQTISLDSQITFNLDWTVNGEEYVTPGHYWESYLQQKSVKKEEQKLFKELKKQSLGLDIEDSLSEIILRQIKRLVIVENIQPKKTVKMGNLIFMAIIKFPIKQ